MNVLTRGIRNAFRNIIRTVSLGVILALSIGLSLVMLVAYRAVGAKIASVKSSVGTTVSVSPAGVRGFEGGGTALTDAQIDKLAKLAHVTAVTRSLNDRLTTADTNLVSAVEAGALGRRNADNSGQGFSLQTPPDDGGRQFGGNGAGGSRSTITRTFTPPVTLVGTTDPTDLAAGAGQGGGSFRLKSGQAFDGAAADNLALVGSSLAAKNNLQTGSTFTAYAKTVKVAGIFDAGNTFSNNQVIMPLKAVQTLSGQPGAVTAATVTVDSIGNVGGVTAAVKSSLGDAADVTNAAERADQTVTPLENIRTISLYSLVGAVVAGAVIILLTMIMIVRERRREIGVLKAIGASNPKIIGQFMAEAVTLTVLGSLLGIAIGFAAGQPVTRLLVSNGVNNAQTTRLANSMNGPGGFGGAGRFAARRLGGLQNAVGSVQANVGWDIILYGLGAALLIAIAGSVLAAFFIARIRPAEVLRSE